MDMVLGTDLPYDLQVEAKRVYIGRFTKDHRPLWSLEEWKDGQSYPVQFASDQDWLANTTFPVCKDGKFSRRSHCRSSQTWPDNPELRTATAA